MTTPAKGQSSLGKLAESQKGKENAFQQDNTLPVLKIPDSIKNRLQAMDFSQSNQERAPEPAPAAPQGSMQQMAPQLGGMQPMGGMPQMGAPMQPQMGSPMQPQMGGQMQPMGGMAVASPMMEAAVMQIRDFLVQQSHQFQQVATYLMQKVDRQDQALTQLAGPQVEMVVDIQKALQYMMQKQQADEAAMQGFIQQQQKEQTVTQARVAEVRGIAKNLEDVLQKTTSAAIEAGEQRATRLTEAVQGLRQAIQQDLQAIGATQQEAATTLQSGLGELREALDEFARDLQKLQENQLIALAEDIHEAQDAIHTDLKAMPGPLHEALKGLSDGLGGVPAALQPLDGLEERLKTAINKLSVSDDLQKIIAVLKSRLEAEPVQQLLQSTRDIQRSMQQTGQEWHDLKEQLIALVGGIAEQTIQQRATHDAVARLEQAAELPPAQQQAQQALLEAIDAARVTLNERLDEQAGALNLEPLRQALAELRDRWQEGQGKLANSLDVLIAAADGHPPAAGEDGGFLKQLNQVLVRMEDLSSQVKEVQQRQETVGGELERLAGEAHALTPIQESVSALEQFMGKGQEEVQKRQATIEEREQAITGLQIELRKLQVTLQEAETRNQLTIQAKELELRIALAGTQQAQEAERRHAQEVAQLHQALTVKDQEKQRAIDEVWRHLEDEKHEAGDLQQRIAELEQTVRQSETRRIQETEELQREIKGLQDKAQGAELVHAATNSHAPEQEVDFMRKFLLECKMFKGLKPFDISLLAGLAHYEEAGEQELVIKEGSPAASFYVVVSGSVELTREKRGKVEELLAVHEGDVFGEESLANDQPRLATATTATPCKLYRFEYDDYRELTKSNLALNKKLPNNLMRIVSERGF